MVAYFFFLRGVGSLSQPRLNIFTVGNMRVIICLGQGGLRSLSASSSLYNNAVIFSDLFCLTNTVKLDHIPMYTIPIELRSCYNVSNTDL